MALQQSESCLCICREPNELMSFLQVWLRLRWVRSSKYVITLKVNLEKKLAFTTSKEINVLDLVLDYAQWNTVWERCLWASTLQDQDRQLKGPFSGTHIAWEWAAHSPSERTKTIELSSVFMWLSKEKTGVCQKRVNSRLRTPFKTVTMSKAPCFPLLWLKLSVTWQENDIKFKGKSM